MFLVCRLLSVYPHFLGFCMQWVSGEEGGGVGRREGEWGRGRMGRREGEWGRGRGSVEEGGRVWKTEDE